MELFVTKPETSALLNGAVDEIKAAGVEATPADICWLYELARDMTSRDEVVGIRFPVELSGVVLYPLTIAASAWLDEYAFRWWPDTDGLYSVTFAMSRSGPDSIGFNDVLTERDARRELSRFAMRFVFATKDELQSACSVLLNNKPGVYLETKYSKKQGAKDSVSCDKSWGRVISLLVREYRRPPADFLSMPTVDVLTMINAINKSSGGGEKQTNTDAFVRFRTVIDHIKKRGSHGG